MSKGIQNNNVLTVDVVYTQLGRFYKSINSPDGEIVKFALSDDGVDYNLYDPNLPDTEKAKKITNSPQFSAWTNETALMRSKLMSLPRNVEEVGSLEVTPSTVLFEINPATKYPVWKQSVTINAGFPTPNGYTVTLKDSRYVYLRRLVTDSSGREIILSDDQGRTRTIRRINTGEGRIIDTINVGGSSNTSSTSTFSITYDPTYRIFDRSTEYKTVVQIESLDRGITKEVDVILRQI